MRVDGDDYIRKTANGEEATTPLPSIIRALRMTKSSIT